MKSVLLVAAVAVAVTGCASDPWGSKSELKVPKKAYSMSRQEVINGISDCEAAGMRPIIITSKRRVSDYYTDVIIDVTCGPKAVQYYR
jgi:hypothetical protein